MASLRRTATVASSGASPQANDGSAREGATQRGQADDSGQPCAPSGVDRLSGRLALVPVLWPRGAGERRGPIRMVPNCSQRHRDRLLLMPEHDTQSPLPATSRTPDAAPNEVSMALRGDLWRSATGDALVVVAVVTWR